jgi:hypothetical protein
MAILFSNVVVVSLEIPSCNELSLSISICDYFIYKDDGHHDLWVTPLACVQVSCPRPLRLLAPSGLGSSQAQGHAPFEDLPINGLYGDRRAFDRMLAQTAVWLARTHMCTMIVGFPLQTSPEIWIRIAHLKFKMERGFRPRREGRQSWAQSVKGKNRLGSCMSSDGFSLK